MLIMSYLNAIKYLSNLLQLEPCSVMFKVMTQWQIGMICVFKVVSNKWYIGEIQLSLQYFLQWKENDLCIDIYNKQS